jgi:hypothetical protein
MVQLAIDRRMPVSEEQAAAARATLSPQVLVIRELALPVIRQALDDVGLLPQALKTSHADRPIRDAAKEVMLGAKRGMFQRALFKRQGEFQKDHPRVPVG